MEIHSTQVASPFNGTQACMDEDPDIFFPDKEDENINYLDAVLEAKLICMGCPIKINCLEYALADSSLLGVWGGTTEDDRKRIRRRSRNKIRT